ncbi:hypothetical protein [Desulfonatronum sp. SC1]|uniref:hypothetical protein n=1 Tax=Desulfonatronum sp. SC1 TaxID=2109626 RepID=UPI000D304212|nr:hypothetical protein [Desulfonatronum sp. SC1]PTN32003.1 hypothetical protein C6366_17160 [Desulfonatronum sp. SC1]
MPRTSTRNQFTIVRFIKDDPVWERFDGQTLHPVPHPDQASKSLRSLPVLVLIPDRLFFFFQPESDHHSGSLRQRTAAARLELEQIFPTQTSEHGPGILLDAGRTHLLGCLPHPELTEFARRHQDILARANAVTTPFFLAWNAGHRRKIESWVWDNPEDGATAAMLHGQMTFFPGNGAELETRIAEASGTGNTGQPLQVNTQWSLPDLLQAAPDIGWSQLRLPLPAAAGEGLDLRRLVRWCIAATLLGGLLCTGQALRLTAQQAQVKQWEQATHRLYAEVLPPPLGDDPFGRLLFRHGQLQGPIQSGPDALAMLGLLSASAPSDFHVETFSLGPNSGIIRARLADYEQLETLLKALEGQDRLRFDLDQASSADDAVLATLRVSY